jgi:hypothetical protein
MLCVGPEHRPLPWLNVLVRHPSLDPWSHCLRATAVAAFEGPSAATLGAEITSIQRYDADAKLDLPRSTSGPLLTLGAPISMPESCLSGAPAALPLAFNAFRPAETTHLRSLPSS